MSKKCLRQAFAYQGIPVIIITITSFLFGLVFLMQENTSGWALILVAVGVLSIFSLIGARNGCIAVTGKK